MDHTGSRRLALIEFVDRDGRVLRTHDVHGWPLRVGRALDNDLVLDDPHVAAHHLVLEPGEEGTLMLQVGDTTNGVQGLLPAPRRHWPAGTRQPLAQGPLDMQLGQTRLRLRRAGEAVAPELPLATAQALPVTAPLLMTTGLAVAVAGSHWVGLDPGADATAWLPVAVGVPVALVLWCGLWALASQLFRHRFDFGGHLRIALPGLLAIEACDLLLEPLAASLGWPWLWRLVPLAQALLAGWLLHRHLLRVLPQARRAVGAFVGAALLAGVVISLAVTHRATDRWSRPPYMSTLPLAGWQWDEPEPAAGLVQALGPMADALAERVQQAVRDDQADTEPE